MVGNTNAILGAGQQGIGIINNWPGVGWNVVYWSGGLKSISSGYGGVIWLDPSNGDFRFDLSTAAATAADQALSGDAKMIIKNNGNVGIGTATPSERLHVVGNFMLVNNGASIAYKDGSLTWSNPSDARLKTNIQPITNALEKITKLRGVSFDWINQDLHQGDAKSGFLAQEMEQVFPDCVQEVEVDSNSSDAKLVGDGKIKTVGLTSGFFATMVEAIKEQQQMIEQQTALIEQQQQKLQQQEQWIAGQQKIIAEQQAKLAMLEQKYSELESKLNKLG